MSFEIDTPPAPAPPGAPPPSWLLQRRVPLLAAGLVVLAVAVWLALRTGHPSRARSIGARLDLAAGDVTVTENGAASHALSGAPLAVDARVATGKGARALVRTGDGSAVFLRGETEIALLEHGVRLEHGEIWLDAPRTDAQPVEVRIGDLDTATASDAGLSVRRDGDDATIYVARGLSILTSPGGRIEINAGERGTAHAKDAPKLAEVAFWQDWTGGMADQRSMAGASNLQVTQATAGSGRIYGVDPAAPPGAHARVLGVAKQIVRATIRDGMAETEVDQTFSNPNGLPLEGWYWFTIPSDAIVTSFALETNGELVEGEVVEKREAAARYEAAVRQAVDPALLEWVDGRSYRARIYPIPASGTRRVVLRYAQVLPLVEGKIRYLYPLRAPDPSRFDEFSLSVDVGDVGPEAQLATSLDATIEPGGQLVTMRRSGYTPQADFQLEMRPKQAPAVRSWRFAAGADQADYVMIRYAPEIDFARLPPQQGSVVVVVDTSASGDETARQLRTAEAEAILRALSDDDHFALVAVDVAPVVLYPKDGLAPANDASIAAALERLSEHATGGATDLGSMFEPALERLHGSEQPAIVYVGDGAPTSGETSPDALVDRMRRSLTGSRARFFAVGIGSGAQHDLLGEMARVGSGMELRVDDAEEATDEALRLTSAIKTPTLTDVDLVLDATLDQPFLSATGKLSRGEELVLLARTHHALPDKVTVKGRIAGKDEVHEYGLVTQQGAARGFVPRLWAAEYARRLLGSGATSDDNRNKVLELGLTYGLMTPYTSILALDSDAAYARQGIPRRASPLRGGKLAVLDGAEDGRLALGAASRGVPALGGCDSPRAAPEASRAASEPSPVDQATDGVRRYAPAPAASYAAPTSAATAAAGAVAPGAVGQSGSVLDDEKDRSTQAAPPPPSPVAAMPQARTGGLQGIHGSAGGGGSGGGFVPSANAHAPKGNGAPTAPRPAKEPKPPVAAPPATAATIAVPHLTRRPLGVCSDAASRPLIERIVLWKKRLARAASAGDLVAQVEMARVACELPDWRDEAALLDLVERRVDTEDAASTLLGYLAGEPEAQRYVARAILRRTVDVRLASAVSRVLFGGKVDWSGVDRDLLDATKPDQREAIVQKAMLVAPGDPEGDMRMVKVLVQDDKRPEALAYGRRLRDRGLLTPTLAQSLGDALADANEVEEAMRTYSEVVEFDDASPTARRVLGDIFLRHGWYAAAYRQYKTLTDLDRQQATAWLRLAAAAAGTGRVDESFRIAQDVASGQGTPGADDPRYWARLWAAARLGELLADPSKAGGDADGITRRLKQLQLWSSPGTLALVTWEDLDARLVMASADAKKETPAGEANDAGDVGLYAVFTQSDTWKRGPWAVRWRADARGRQAQFHVVSIAWDGKGFHVNVERGALNADERQAQLGR